MRRPRPSTLVCRSLDGFLTTLLLLLAAAAVVVTARVVVVVVLVVVEGSEDEGSKVLECMEMEPMKGPWPAGA